jgi:aryl-alcohol dehydrogenase-like predicted oxidoreductase
VEKRRAQLEQFESLCDSLGEKPADVAMAWVLHNPVVTAPILGPRTMAHLEGALHAMELKLDTETMSRLDTIFPGPGGAAPEAYAW